MAGLVSIIRLTVFSLKACTAIAIARNVCKDRLRSASPETLSLELAAESGLEPESSERTEDNVAEHWLHETILSAIGELEDPARSVFYERYYEGRSVRDIALHLQLSEKKTENILHRGKSKLRSILAEKGVTSYEEFEK